LAAKRIPPLVPSAGRKRKLSSKSGPRTLLTMALSKKSNLVFWRYICSARVHHELYLMLPCWIVKGSNVPRQNNELRRAIIHE
jgi:hypothetical protein